MAYLLDANLLIAAKNLHYGCDFCPAFWDWLVESNAASTVFRPYEMLRVERARFILGHSA